MLTRGEKGHAVWRMNTECARLSKPISCFEMRLCCKQAHGWKKQPPISSPLECAFSFCAVFSSLPPSPRRLPAIKQDRELIQTCQGRFRLVGLGLLGMWTIPLMLQTGLSTQKNRSLSSRHNHKERFHLSLMEINVTGEKCSRDWKEGAVWKEWGEKHLG